MQGHVVGLLEDLGCSVKPLYSQLPTSKRDREKCLADPTRPVNVFEVTLSDSGCSGEGGGAAARASADETKGGVE